MERLLSAFSLFLVLSLSAQDQKEVVSPEIASDGSVTFRLSAPEAKSVRVVGDFATPPWTPLDLNKGADGTWTYTTPALPSEMYTYRFTVDGAVTTDPGNILTVRDAMNVLNYFIVGNGKADAYKVKDIPHGTVSHRWYDSPAIGKQRRISVYTPPGYEQGKAPYPVLYLMHGVGGDENAWLELGRAAQILDHLIATKTAKPMVVVMTNGHAGNAAAPGESPVDYRPVWNAPDVFNGQFEDSFGDVMRFAESNYRIRKSKSGRAIAGLSMGGFHTLYISANYPDTFDYMGLFSAATIEPRNTASNIYKSLEDKLTLQQRNGYKLYWTGMGKTDFLYEPFRDFRSKLDAKAFKYTYFESEGGHTWANWRVYLTEFVPLLFQ